MALNFRWQFEHGFVLCRWSGTGLHTERLGFQGFALVGDGECDEGLIWEAAMSAANYHLNNLVVIVDRNKLQYDGLTSEVMNQIDLAEKFKSFGFETRVVDGHDVDALVSALDNPSENQSVSLPIPLREKVSVSWRVRRNGIIIL